MKPPLECRFEGVTDTRTSQPSRSELIVLQQTAWYIASYCQVAGLTEWQTFGT